MESIRCMIVSGKHSGETGKIHEYYWRRKDGSGWKPPNFGSDKRFKDNEEWEKYYLVVPESVAFGGPKPVIISADSIKIMDKNYNN